MSCHPPFVAASGWARLGCRRDALRERVALSGAQSQSSHGAMEHAAHAMGPVGRVSTEAFDPATYLRAWNFSDLPAEERAALLQGNAASRRHAAPGVPDRRGRSRDRDRAGHVLSRRGPSTARCRGRRFARPKATASGSRSSTRARTRTRCISTGGIRPKWTGRCPNIR